MRRSTSSHPLRGCTPQFKHIDTAEQQVKTAHLSDPLFSWRNSTPGTLAAPSFFGAQQQQLQQEQNINGKQQKEKQVQKQHPEKRDRKRGDGMDRFRLLSSSSSGAAAAATMGCALPPSDAEVAAALGGAEEAEEAEGADRPLVCSGDEDFDEVELTPGSFLYHPAGVWHKVECTQDSVSINLSLMPQSFAQLLANALQVGGAAMPAYACVSRQAGRQAGSEAAGARACLCV
jgi:hypothetical protein